MDPLGESAAVSKNKNWKQVQLGKMCSWNSMKLEAGITSLDFMGKKQLKPHWDTFTGRIQCKSFSLQKVS